MQFIDLAFQQYRIRDQIEKNIRAVLGHCQYIMGPEVKRLEECLAAYVGVNHAIACSSGTDALLMALMAHKVGPGDAVFTTPFSFVATAEVIRLIGAVPIFVDIDPLTYNIAPEALSLAISALAENDPAMYPLPVGDSAVRGAAPSLTARGVIAVDLFGLPADYDAIKAIAREHGLFVIEDGAQSFGAHALGKRAGSLADVGCTSFFPSKPLGCYGDGGMCFTDDDALADRMRSIRLHGQGRDRYENIRIGINGRLDTLQAAVLLAKFEIFPDEIERRQAVAAAYTDLLICDSSLRLQYVPQGYASVWAQYTVRARDEIHRSHLRDQLKAAGVPTGVYYPKPLHLQTAFAELAYEVGDFPVSEEFSQRVFSLPMHPYLKREELQIIAHCIANPSA